MSSASSLYHDASEMFAKIVADGWLQSRAVVRFFLANSSDVEIVV